MWQLAERRYVAVANFPVACLSSGGDRNEVAMTSLANEAVAIDEWLGLRCARPFYTFSWP